MIRVYEIGRFPIQGLHCRVGFGANTGRLAVDNQVFAIGFIPHRRHINPKLAGSDKRRQLSVALMGETITDTHAESWKLHILCLHNSCCASESRSIAFGFPVILERSEGSDFANRSISRSFASLQDDSLKRCNGGQSVT